MQLIEIAAAAEVLAWAPPP